MQKKRVLKNYTYHLIYQIVAMVVVFFSMPYVSRVLGASNVGVYSYTNANVSYFTLLAAIGLHWYGEREIAFTQNDVAGRSKVFFQIMILKGIMFAVSIFFYVIYLESCTVNVTICLLQGIVLIAVIFDISWFFRGIEDFKIIALWHSVMKLLGMLAMFVFVKSENDLAVYVIIQGLVILGSNIVLWFYLPKMVEKKYFTQVSLFRDYRVILEMSIPGIAVRIYNVLDKTMLGIIKQNMLENGYYEQVGKIVTVVIVMITSLSSVLAPNVASRYSKGDMQYVEETANKAYRFMLFFSNAACFGLIAVSNHFVPLFLGEEFVEAVPLMVVYALVILVIPVSNVAGNVILAPIKRHNNGTIAVILGAITNIIMNLLLIPKYSALGAVVATIIAETVVTLVHIYYAKDMFLLKDTAIDSLKFMFCGLCMMAVIWILNMQVLEQLGMKEIYLLVIDILVGAAVYLMIAYLLKGKTLIKEIISVMKGK